MTNSLLVLSLLIIMARSATATSYVRTAGVNCGTGTSQTIYPGDRIKCCSNELVKGYDFKLTTTKNFAYSSEVRLSQSSSSSRLSGSDCDVHSSGQTCSGEACYAAGSYLNDCKADICCYSSDPGYYCMHVSCDEPEGVFGLFRGDDCEFNEWSLSFDSASSPPPPSPPPPSSTSCSTHSSCAWYQYCDQYNDCYPCASYFLVGGLSDTYNGITEGCTYLTRPPPPSSGGSPPSPSPPPPSPPPSGGSSSTYSPSYTGTGSSNVRIPTYTTRKATKATGRIAGIVVGVVVTFLIAVVKYCCFTKKNEAAEENEQNTTPPVTVLVQQQNTEGRDEPAAMPTMPMEAKQKPSPTVTDSTATSKFCTKCGSAIVSNGMFCASCGKAASS